MNQAIQFHEAAVFDDGQGLIRLDATFNGWRIPCYFHPSWFSETKLVALQAATLISQRQWQMEAAIEQAIEDEALDAQGELHFD
ncbi:hypothetical protein [Gallaecimonas sp. GXIMD1310]|uniref:hypothetical protein n=1 Tax=Gallaecimonas sp. GXIMD1310 TaxID=3131926 RepID=UPI00324E3CBB